ncbi:hypothetical protein NQ315_002225 [Exocentrus adspersus]|uniref:BZIP domain-containing protein n=1 Tax=Exocentrus adspersus TaxID=1586481 RepID=A0AAV8VZ23_9CUCU|nr:hypothetical protein NQ315_002225 [Exocentrus adspersus]
MPVFHFQMTNPKPYPTYPPMNLQMTAHHAQNFIKQEEPPVLDLCIRNKHHSPTSYTTLKEIETPLCPVSPSSQFSDSSELSCTDINSNTTKLKTVRPFKAYPKDPLSISLIGAAHDLLNKDSSAAYMEFRQKMLAEVQNSYKTTNKNMRRIQSTQQVSDPTYWEKRKKNNEAAKRSRDARRAKEDEIAVRCAYLEQENVQLRYRLAAAEAERKRLYDMLYS